MALHKHNTHDKFEIESAARSLREVAKIRANPKLLKSAVARLEEEKHEIEHAQEESTMLQRAEKRLKKTFGD